MSEIITPERFIALLRNEFDLGDVPPAELLLRRLVDDLGFDSLELFRLMVVAESICPGFEFPAQMATGDIRLADVYDLVCHRRRTMGVC